jgi:hypothetical protein
MTNDEQQNINNAASNQGAQGIFYGPVKFTQTGHWLVASGAILATAFLVFVMMILRPSSTTVSGDQSAIVIGPVSDSQITQTINVGDPPEKRSRFIAAELLYYLKNVDARLGLTQEVVLLDDIDRQLESTRATVAPALDEAIGGQYRQLITTAQVSELENAWNAYPLTNEPGEALLSLLEGTGADPEEVRFFYQQLGEVQWASNGLLDVMREFADESARSDVDNEAWLAFSRDRLELAQETLQNRTLIAHLVGLRILDDLQVPGATINAQLGTLQYLTPQQLVDVVELEQLLVEATDQAATLSARRAALVTRGEELVQDDLDSYTDLEEDLMVQPDDPWNIVVAKAISLRQLGRKDDAVAAFATYGRMFADEDPTAVQYATTAQAFTRQMDQMGIVDGAVYIYTLHENSPARATDVQIGDVIVSLNEQTIRSVPDYSAAIGQATPGESAILELLRLQQDGTFEQMTMTIEVPTDIEGWPGLLGLGVMPV